MMRLERALDWLNFLLADVQSGLGLYLAIYLLTAQHWSEERIGIVMTIAGLATLAVQTPAGALIDAAHWKRGIVAAACALIGGAAIAVTMAPRFAIVATAQVAMGAAAAVFPPAISAIALGLVGPRRFTPLMGRMQAFNHAGNVAAAAVAGALGTLVATGAVFWLVAGLAACAIVATHFIDHRAIDHELARGFRHAADKDGEDVSGLRVLVACRPLLIFAASIILFHLANAAILPVVGQKLALGNSRDGALFMSALMEGTGRFNVAQGAAATMQSVGAALSTTIAGFIIVAGGYNAAFLALAAIGEAATLLFFLMPETMPEATRRRQALPGPAVQGAER